MTKTELLAKNELLQKENDMLSIVMWALSDRLPAQHPNPDVIRVGDFWHDGIKITLRLIGPKRANGGIVLLSQRIKGQRPDHNVWLLDELNHKMQTIQATPFYGQMRELVSKAVAMRESVLKGGIVTKYGVIGRLDGEQS